MPSDQKPGIRPVRGKQVLVEAPAKVNLGLKILGRRADGYHDLDTVFQAVSLTDTLVLSERPSEAAEPGGAVHLTDEGLRLEVRSPWPVPCDDSNLAVRAARAFAGREGRSLEGLGLRIEKRIPPGGGLAGGSADAAGTLVGLAALWGLDASPQGLHDLGLGLGSDVPFCLMGGTARGLGRGEILTPVARKLEFWMTMVNPGTILKTSKAFAAFDPARHGRAGDLSRLVEALEEARPEPFVQSLGNTFEECLEGVFPLMRRLKDQLIEAGCSASLLSGSGATIWGLAWTEQQAREAAAVLRPHYPFVHAVRPIPFGPMVRMKL